MKTSAYSLIQGVCALDSMKSKQTISNAELQRKTDEIFTAKVMNDIFEKALAKMEKMIDAQMR